MKTENTIFLYPSNPLDQRKIDEKYYEEFTMAQSIGLSVHLLNIENMETNIPASNKSRIVYRGWMLSDAEYTKLEQKFGDRLLTSKKKYFNAHYLPNWYEDIKPFTIHSIITDEEHAAQQLKSFSGKAFIKDYVKSLKTGKGSIVESTEDLQQAIANMKFYRGCIEGGIVLREVVNLQPNSEVRFFVAKNKIFSPVVDHDKHQVAEQVIKQLEHKKMDFYSVDIANTTNGHNIVIEVGDEQVSDHVGWNLKDFIVVLKYLEK